VNVTCSTRHYHLCSPDSFRAPHTSMNAVYLLQDCTAVCSRPRSVQVDHTSKHRSETQSEILIRVLSRVWLRRGKSTNTAYVGMRFPSSVGGANLPCRCLAAPRNTIETAPCRHTTIIPYDSSTSTTDAASAVNDSLVTNRLSSVQQ
jgi:hypothetical protein